MDKRLRHVKALVQSTFFDSPSDEQITPEHKAPVVTLSRGFGSHGGKTAELLAERLGVKCYGYNLLDSFADTLKHHKHLTRLFDEKFTDAMDHWVLSLFTGGKASKDEYLRCLVKAVTGIAQTGGVIIGRGAHLILAENHSVFRVKVEGSLEVCSQRVAAREGISPAAASAHIHKIENERKAYVQELYRRFPSNRSYYDLMINSDYLEPEQMVKIILFSMQQRGLLPASAE